MRRFEQKSELSCLQAWTQSRVVTISYFINIFLSLIIILLASTLCENYGKQKFACFYCFKNGGKLAVAASQALMAKNIGEGLEEGEDAL